MQIDAVVRRGAVCGRPTDTLQHAANLMCKTGVGALPVYEGDRLAGIITERDLLRAMGDDRIPEKARVER